MNQKSEYKIVRLTYGLALFGAISWQELAVLVQAWREEGIGILRLDIACAIGATVAAVRSEDEAIVWMRDANLPPFPPVWRSLSEVICKERRYFALIPMWAELTKRYLAGESSACSPTIAATVRATSGEAFKIVNPADQSVVDMIPDAIRVIRKTRRASVSAIQRHLRIGYNQAFRIIEMLEARGIVGPETGSSPRAILVDLDAVKAA